MVNGRVSLDSKLCANPAALLVMREAKPHEAGQVAALGKVPHLLWIDPLTLANRPLHPAGDIRGHRVFAHGAMKPRCNQ